MIAHLGPLPVEELVPLATTASASVVFVRAWVARRRHPSRSGAGD